MDRWVPRAVALAAVVSLVLGLAGYRLTAPPAATSPAAAAVTTAARSASTLQGAWRGDLAVSVTPTYTVADAAGPVVAIYSAPGVVHAETPILANPTHEGLPVVFLVLGEQGGWLRVRVSARPNNLVAWIKRSEVTLRSVPNRILVEVGARRVTVFQGDRVLLQETVAVGSARTPTPLGNFFVDGMTVLDPDTGPYGAGQVSVSGFSDALRSFGGGIGQIALHGTNRPDLVGEPVSNGCVRMTNDAIRRVSLLAPLGTPVDIVA